MKDSNPLSLGKWVELKKRGLEVGGDVMDVISLELSKGVDDVKRYLNITGDSWDDVVVPEGGNLPGYVPHPVDKIALPISFLNQFVDGLEGTISILDPEKPDNKVEMDKRRWFRIFAREETIHRYQCKRHPGLTFPTATGSNTLESLA
ncbi:hypothetical protein HYV64_04005 [Candidatus Shapirobacteria bacterium]|nr:hypothetical protein [Candidatus Shapirobacteria bacterium]